MDLKIKMKMDPEELIFDSVEILTCCSEIRNEKNPLKQITVKSVL